MFTLVTCPGAFYAWQKTTYRNAGGYVLSGESVISFTTFVFLIQYLHKFCLRLEQVLFS